MKDKLKDLVEEYQRLGKEIKELESLRKEVKESLTKRLEPGEVKAGVKRVSKRNVSVSWSKVWIEVLGYVPKSKRNEVESVKDKYTKEYFVDVFSTVE